MKTPTKEAITMLLAWPMIIGLMLLGIGILGPIADMFEGPSRQTVSAVDSSGNPVALSFMEKYALLGSTWKLSLCLIAFGSLGILWDRLTSDKKKPEQRP